MCGVRAGFTDGSALGYVLFLLIVDEFSLVLCVVLERVLRMEALLVTILQLK